MKTGNLATPTQCDVSITSWSALFNPICWGRFVGSFIGGLIVYMASWFLTISGVLFNWVLNVTVVQFGQFMTDSVIAAVTSAWTAFRDISNIIIIGMFTFIAISIILGLKEFGQKKLIAHVLIIAILINFSLLFSKMVIDASNFVATQFYNAGLSQSAAGGVTSTTQLGIGNCPDGTPKSQCYGIAGAFMDYAGVASLLDTRKATANLADSLDNGFIAFLHAIFVAVLFTAAALVLFYGSFLLISRGILFIFLMAVSSLAFASYLVPVWDKSNYGFGAWKESILKNALLAPLMIMFLWMTLNIANAMKQGASGGTLGDLITDSTKSLDINALFSYLAILGMLFISFKLSSHLAGKISGFSWAAVAPALGVAAGSRVAGLLGRYSLGLGAGVGARALQRAGKSVEQAGYTRTAKALLSTSRPFESIAKKDFNLMNTQFGKEISGKAGLKGVWSGATNLGGMEGVQKALATQYAKDAEKLTTSKDEKDKLRKDTIASFEGRQQFKEQRNLLKGLKETAEQNLSTNERIAAQNKAPLQKEHGEAQKGLDEMTKAVKDSQKQIRDNFDQQIKGVAEQLANAGSPGESTQLSGKIRGLEKQRDAELRTEENRIQQAREKVAEIQSRIKVEDDRVQSARDQLQKVGEEDTKLTQKIGEEADAEIKRRYPNLDKTTDLIASKLANTRATNMFGALISEENDHLANLARKQSKESAEDKRIKRAFQKNVDDLIKEKSPSDDKSGEGH